MEPVNDPLCRPDIQCPCENLSDACIGRTVAETPTHQAVITQDRKKEWIRLRIK
jgi:hypothetical protein